MAMTLEEVAYIINGRVRVRDISEDDELSNFEATLLDAINDPVTVDVPSKNPGRRFESQEAKVIGPTPEKAREELVQLLRGRVINYDVAIMWTSVTQGLAVPPTLTVGKEGKISRLKVLDEEEKVASSGRFRATTLVDSEVYQIGDDVESLEAAKALCAAESRSADQIFQVFNDQGVGLI